jgi:hypothetical protein
VISRGEGEEEARRGGKVEVGVKGGPRGKFNQSEYIRFFLLTSDI